MEHACRVSDGMVARVIISRNGLEQHQGTWPTTSDSEGKHSCGNVEADFAPQNMPQSLHNGSFDDLFDAFRVTQNEYNFLKELLRHQSCQATSTGDEIPEDSTLPRGRHRQHSRSDQGSRADTHDPEDAHSSYQSPISDRE